MDTKQLNPPGLIEMARPRQQDVFAKIFRKGVLTLAPVRVFWTVRLLAAGMLANVTMKLLLLEQNLVLGSGICKNSVVAGNVAKTLGLQMSYDICY